MGKFFLRFFLIIFITIVISITYLSYFGLETNRFDNLIKNKANNINRYVKLEFNKTKIHLNITELNLLVKLQNPKILIKDNQIDLSKFDLFLSIKSFYSSDFLLKKANVGFEQNDIKDITKITNIFLPRIINKKLNKIFHKGTLEGEFTIPFETDGDIGKNYGFSGRIIDASINIRKDFNIKNLTTEIGYGDEVKNGGFEAIIKKGSLFDLNLESSKINLKREKNKTQIKSLLYTNGVFDFEKIKKISNIFNFDLSDFENINGKANLKTNIAFDLDKRFKLKNLSYSTEGNISNIELHTKEKKIVKKYLPKYDPKIIFKDTIIKFTKSQSEQIAELNGLIKITDKFDKFKIKQKYNLAKKNYDIEGSVDLTNSEVNISKLNYIKDNKKKSNISFNTNFVFNKKYNIKKFQFLENQTQINLSNLILNKNFEVEDFKKIEIKTFSDSFKNNDFVADKSKEIVISGEIFDAQPLLKSLYKKDDKKTFSKDFTSNVKINFNKALTGTNDNVSDFSMIASITGGSYNKLSLKGNFSENEILEMSIYQIDKDKKTLQVISDRARPFIKNFNFIKGFEGGKLEYESIIKKNVSESNLIITDFKVSKVPALAKLLTLASLQGIADTLSGEGIRFESFEMKSKSESNLLTIEEALAIGPAVSILLEGYVDKGKTVSLRGTLVPATKLNAIIASIPLVGDILVGKKTGEGVVGVSFKMKGPPKDIKTTVNPIKTLTPRFIVRAVEKMKKKKKEETK